MKKVSILMMTYNNATNIEKTLKCVEQQDYPDIEIVISDGLSTDGTVDIIRKFSENSEHEVKWVSEKDNGLYDALNKDIDMASGTYLLCCNDQLIQRSAISKMVDTIERENADGVHCDLIYADEEKVKRYWHMAKGTINSGWMPGHPTLMLKKEVYEKFGKYDANFKIAADYEFMVRILSGAKKTKIAYVPEILVRMYYGGTSTGSAASYLESIKEGHIALVQNQVKGPCVIDLLRMCRVLFQFVRKNKAEKMWKEYRMEELEEKE